MTSSAGPGELRLGIETAVEGSAVRVSIRGEADISTLERLDAALDGLVLNGAQSVRLDLTELGFADVATIRRLKAFATRARKSGHDVTTCGADPMFRMIARLLDGRDHLGLL